VKTSNLPNSQHTLLLVEDTLTEVQIVQRAMKGLARPVHLCVVRDGQEAMDYLLGQGAYAAKKAPRPHLVLLDLNLPRLTGLEVLGQMREHADLCSVPVVLWSTSRKPEDIRAGYLAGANTFFEKPRDFQRLCDLLDGVLKYWFESALLPPP
jgi:CheY-like chemotaxis protein